MQQTALVEYLDGAGQERMRDEILMLLGLTHAPEKQTPHAFSLADAGNHTVSLYLISKGIKHTIKSKHKIPQGTRIG